jgi:dimethylhistidine N-methyltransferase
MPVDISRDHLWRSAAAIAEDYPAMAVHAVCADYTRTLDLPDPDGASRHAAFFPGSSIGNFDPPEARELLQRIAGMLGPEGRLLIGVDLKKDHATLNAAYNDAEGVTAAFNLNLLARINRELDADFDLSGFTHRAFYDADRSRIEMHLVAVSPQQVQIDGCRFEFTAGESIHTENSYKYSVAEFQALAASAGFTCERVWQDADARFSVHCLCAA